VNEPVGTKIEGSQYVRDYCFMCGEPIRVSAKNILWPNACSVCRPEPRKRMQYTDRRDRLNRRNREKVTASYGDGEYHP
jgi:hypothetical protein